MKYSVGCLGHHTRAETLLSYTRCTVNYWNTMVGQANRQIIREQNIEEQKKDELNIQSLTPKELIKISTLFESSTYKNFIRIGPKGYFIKKKFAELSSDIYNMEPRAGDVVVASIQRSGTTWTQELVWMIANDLDYEKAAAIPLTQRFPCLESAMFFDEAAIKFSLQNSSDIEKTREVLDIMSTPTIKLLYDLPSPRFMKTHLAMSLLNPKILGTAKVVYVARDPRDVVVSCFFVTRWFKVLQFKGTLKDMWHAFKDDLFLQMPYFEHVKEAWALRHHPNMLFLFYEELSKDLPASIRRVSDFLGKQLTAAQVERLSEHLSFDNFKNNQSVNFDDMKDSGVFATEEQFIRKGKVGGWRDYFDEEMTRESERWIADNLRGTDLTFPTMNKVIE